MKANCCPWHLRSLGHAHQMSCVQPRPLKHSDSASVSFHLCVSLITPVSYAMLYNYDDVLLSMLLLFLLCSWAELNSHTLIVEHCIKNTRWVGLTGGHMDSSCIICIFILKLGQAIAVQMMNSEFTSRWIKCAKPHRLLCNILLRLLFIYFVLMKHNVISNEEADLMIRVGHHNNKVSRSVVWYFLRKLQGAAPMANWQQWWMENFRSPCVNNYQW